MRTLVYKPRLGVPLLIDRATTDFVRVDGSTKPSDLVETPAAAYVISAADSLWICTLEDLRELPPDEPLERSLRYVVTATVLPADADGVPTGVYTCRIALVDPGRQDSIVGVVIDGPMEMLAMAAPPPDEPTMAEPPAPEPPPVTRSFDLDQIRNTPQDLGTTRGGDQPTPDDVSPDAGAEPIAAQPGEEAAKDEPWNVESHFPREVNVGSTTSLTVELTQTPSDDPTASIVPFAAPAGTRVDVVVQVKKGFKLHGAAEGNLVTSLDTGPIRFQLEATAVGAGFIRVLFFIEATAIGDITLEPAILPEDGNADDSPIPTSSVVPSLEIGRGRPDLELLVLEELADGQPAYSIRVTAADEKLEVHLRKFGPIRLRSDPRDFFEELFRGIETLPLGTPDERAAAQKLLEKKGDSLFQTLIPEDLQALLWKLKDQITRIRIDSEEAYIPWELIRLSGPDESGRVVSGKFLCEYETTRWIPGRPLNSELTLRDFGVVIPSDSGLASAQEERVFLTGLADEDRTVTEVPATFVELLDALAAGTHDVWHFSGHGAVKDDQDPNRFAIRLSDGQQFTPEELAGPSANLGVADPLVFLNACQVGQGGMSLTGLGGWASRFLDAGAAGFVGAMWNVHDNPARDFSKTFYTRLLAGDTIAAATLSARQKIQAYQDATWLAYTVYAHPSAAMTVKE